MILPAETIPFLFEPLENDLFTRKNIKVTVARLDKIHPVVSGNKIYKLHFFLKEAIRKNKPILTYGGVYSNHLVATAYACRELGIKCTGVVRGMESISHTISRCKEYGMDIKFISKELYNKEKRGDQTAGDFIEIPEGGYHPLGAAGASIIMEKLIPENPSHICIAVGTGTTLAGLLQQATSESVIAIPVIKNMVDIRDRINYLNNGNTISYPHVLDTYHFGGYAKHTTVLINFMNQIYRGHTLETDFVYTAKMMYAVFDQAEKDFFPAGSHVMCLHTGGLQGNESLPGGTLIF